MVFLLATLLTAAPAMREQPAQTVTLQTRVDFGGMIISYWYVPETRAHIEAALDNAKGTFLGTEILDGHALMKAVPVLGPWASAMKEEAMAIEDRALLCVTGLLQLVGLSVGAMQLFEPASAKKPKGPVLSVSPIAFGHLGLSVKLVGY